MSEVRQQILVAAPIGDVWDLVGNPERYPSWLPRVFEIQGERFEEGAEFIQISRQPLFGQQEAHFLVQARDELEEIRMTCTVSGMFVHWRLAGAQGNTFVDVVFGMDPLRWQDRLFDLTAGRPFLRRWLNEAVASLRSAASQ